jgi:multicomponent Na+:H+ antiporter subunit E
MTEASEQHFVAFVDAAASVDYALREARDAARERGRPVGLDLVVSSEDAERAVGRAVEAAEVPATVHVTVVRLDPTGSAWRDHLAAHDVDHVLVDPDVPGADAIRAADGTVERVPRGRERQRRQLVHDGGVVRFAATFTLSYLFYLSLGNPFDPFDLVTGVPVAGVVATLLSSTLFETPPAPGTILPRLGRATLFVPYLLYEVAKANLAVAAVILRPSLPIDPQMVALTDVPDDRFERALLANAITLTPGTVTVDVRADRFVVHTLTASTRRGLVAGSLTRAVAYVFHGRATDRAGGTEGPS